MSKLFLVDHWIFLDPEQLDGLYENFFKLLKMSHQKFWGYVISLRDTLTVTKLPILRCAIYRILIVLEIRIQTLKFKAFVDNWFHILRVLGTSLNYVVSWIQFLIPNRNWFVKRDSRNTKTESLYLHHIACVPAIARPIYNYHSKTKFPPLQAGPYSHHCSP